MLAVIQKHLRCTGQAGCFTGNTISDHSALLAGFFVDREPFPPKGLPYMWEVQIVVEGGGDPDISGFDTAMVGTVQGRTSVCCIL